VLAALGVSGIESIDDSKRKEFLGGADLHILRLHRDTCGTRLFHGHGISDGACLFSHNPGRLAFRDWHDFSDSIVYHGWRSHRAVRHVGTCTRDWIDFFVWLFGARTRSRFGATRARRHQCLREHEIPLGTDVHHGRRTHNLLRTRFPQRSRGSAAGARPVVGRLRRESSGWI